MKIDNIYAEKKNDNKGYTSAFLTFINLKGNSYKKGNLVVEQTLSKEDPKSPLCELAKFTDILIEDCTINESNNMNISICANAIGKENMIKLYEWIKKYANEDKVSEIAPGLLEALNIEQNSTVNESEEDENSVASRFSKYRKLFEDNSEESANSVNEDDTADVSENKDDKNSEDDKDDKEDNKEDNKDSEGDDKEDKEDKENNDESKEEDEEEELTAIVIEVAETDKDAAKEELIDAGVDEDDIEFLEDDEDEDEDKEDEDKEDKNEESEDKEDEDKEDKTVKIKILVNSFDALKEYLEGKGFDLEAELGGEIVTDDSEDSEDSDEEKDDDSKQIEDTFDGFDDLFADTEEK